MSLRYRLEIFVLNRVLGVQIMVKPATLDPSMPLSDDISQQLPPLLFAIEESDCLARQCCHNNRGFNVRLDASFFCYATDNAHFRLTSLPLSLSPSLSDAAATVQMHILDATNQQVLQLERPFTCTAKCTGVCMCPCPPNRLTVKLPSGQVLGEIIETNPLCNCDQ